MHRATPLNTSFRSYSSGGARTVIDQPDDDKQMQEMKGNFMKNETRDSVECPQNYGFTSVVLPAKKGKNGELEEGAEGFISFIGGNRSFPVCTVMDDRRHRPMGLKAGENAQYDDIGQMTLMRRNGLYMLTLDCEDDSQQSSQGGGTTPATQAESGGQKKVVERFVSMRHVEKPKQQRDNKSKDQSGGQSGVAASQQQAATSGGGQQKKDFKHEGETVNTEIRCTKNRIEFRVGDTVVGYYDKSAKRWSFTGEMRLGTDDAKHPVYGVGDGGTGNTTDKTGEGAVLVKAPNPGPPTSLDTEP